MKIIIIKSGRFKGKKFRVEGTLEEIGGSTCLVELASQGNFAAKNALYYDGYKHNDAPFYYGKIDDLGYIISKKDLGI